MVDLADARLVNTVQTRIDLDSQAPVGSAINRSFYCCKYLFCRLPLEQSLGSPVVIQLVEFSSVDKLPLDGKSVLKSLLMTRDQNPVQKLSMGGGA